MNAPKHSGKIYTRRKRDAWEAANGPVPDKHVIICLDGNENNVTPDNLACVSYSVMRIMATQGLFSDNPEYARAGIAAAEHRAAILRLIEKAVERNVELNSERGNAFERYMAILREKPESPAVCEKCLKTKCRHWRYSLRGKTPPVCAKYNAPIKGIEAFLQSERGREDGPLREWKREKEIAWEEYWKQSNCKKRPVTVETCLKLYGGGRRHEKPCGKTKNA